MAGLLVVAVTTACAPEPPAIYDAAAATEATASTAAPSVPNDLHMTQAGTRAYDNSTSLPGADSGTDAEGCDASPEESAVQYDMNATLDWLAHSLRASQHVRFWNDTGRVLRDIRFNVEPNREEGYFELTRVRLNGVRTTAYALDGAQLTVDLAEALEPGCLVELQFEFAAAIPTIRDGYRYGHLGYWGYSERQINLGLWHPILAAHDRTHGWISPSFHDVGEYTVLRAADFSLNFTVKNAPQNVKVACPGVVTQDDDHSWHVALRGARDLTISVSDVFKSLKTTTESGVEVQLYYLSTPSVNALDAPRHALTVASDALTLFETDFGQYPYEHLIIVEGDFPDGMEFSGLVFVSEAWFRTWGGEIADWLTIITVHETAHQWWYALVGNDQGQHPYLDEALAVYSEYLFFEHYFPEHADWWWDFRVNSYAAEGVLDVPIYEFDNARQYINDVYLRGALMLDQVRRLLGDDAFFAWLSRYVDAMSGKVASPIDLWGALSGSEYAGTRTVRASFLRDSRVLPSKDSIP